MPWDLLKTIGLSEDGPVRHILDQMLAGLGISAPKTHSARNKAAFTIAVVTLAAKMSKADGVASWIEAETFERIFSVPESERDNLRRVFKLASQDVAGFESYAGQIAKLLQNEPELKVPVLECLFHIASADGILHPCEDKLLALAAERFGLTTAEYQTVRRAFVIDPDSPYEVLGVSPASGDDEIRQRYRKLVREHHPDALVASGVPAEFLAAAGRRLAAVNAAYEAIRAERGLAVAQTLESSP